MSHYTSKEFVILKQKLLAIFIREFLGKIKKLKRFPRDFKINITPNS